MNKRDDIIAGISEAEVPAPAWSGKADEPGAVLEEDLRSLMHQLADVRLDLEEANKRRGTELREILLAVLEVGDSFDRVFRNVRAKEAQLTPQVKKWIENFRSARRKLDTLLGDRGVTPIQTLDGRFDPMWHHIAETVANPERADGSIIEELKAGYLWDQALLRKAEVVVVRNDEDS